MGKKYVVVMRTNTKRPKFWSRIKLDSWTTELQDAELFELQDAEEFFEGMEGKVEFPEVRIMRMT